MPENTLPAFRKALELGVTTLELDVLFSRDSQLVVSHDPWFSPVFSTAPDGKPVEDKNRWISEMDYADIRRYDVGLRKNPSFPEQASVAAWKPLLEDVIREAEQRAPGKVHYSIELKVSGMSPATAERLSDRVNTCLKSVPVPASVTIQSFDAAVLRYWRRQIAAGTFLPVRLSALTTWKGVRKIERELGFRPDVYSPFYRRVTRRLIRKTHENGMKIVPWTVNSARIMRRMVRSGADGLITDYPDRFPR